MNADKRSNTALKRSRFEAQDSWFITDLRGASNAEHQRCSILQPRVGATAPTLGASSRYAPTLKGLHPRLPPLQPLQGCAGCAGQPRVAAAPQPWAEGWNTVGVLRKFVMDQAEHKYDAFATAVGLN